MRAIFPILLVIIGLGVREYADRNIPGGLASADRAAIVHLTRQSVMACLEKTSPQFRRLLHDVFENRDTRQERSSPVRRRGVARRNGELSGFDEYFEKRVEASQMFEVTFVSPADEAAESAKRRSGRRSRRRR